MDGGVWWSGDGDKGCLCNDVVIMRQEDVRYVGKGGSGVKTEGMEGCIRVCDGGECLRVGWRRWMSGERIFWNMVRVCERKRSRDCSMRCVCVYHWSGG